MAKKPTTKKTTATKPAKTVTKKPTLVSEKKPADPNLIKKKDIYDNVILATGIRKKDARAAIDATFEYIRQCLLAGKDVQVTPMGKIRVITRDTDKGPKTHYKVNVQDPSVAKPTKTET